jgi:hypothetical protein
VTTASWWQARLEKAMTHVEELEDAISGLVDGSIQSYQLDSGQTRTLVTKQQMSPMYLALMRAENRVATLSARVEGAGFRMVPDF